MNASTRFVIIDDDMSNNKICSITLSKLSNNADIKTFLDPLEGFNHIIAEYSSTEHSYDCVLFLDVNMPSMNGWEFLDRFDKLDDRIKNRIKTYILSSSVDKKDIERANQNKYVSHYLIKPLTKETIKLITYTENAE